MTHEEEIISSVKRDYIENLASQNKRADARSMDQYREISVEPGWARNAEGSALVKLGNTQVLAGVKLERGTPYPDKPESGVLITTAELVPVAHPTFEPGPPGEETVELARVVDRGIRESETIDLDKMVIEPGEEVWLVYVDIYVLDHDGNLIDASALASIAALWHMEIPEDLEDWTLPELPVSKKPIATTVAKISDKIMVDPCFDEESVMDSRLTITTMENGDICAMQKGGSGPLLVNDVREAYELARTKSKELRKYIE
ncbi:RNA-binding protein [candidate division MSBL1 archaeon SCGC-AAA261F19]|uniref:Exosome complex component Rrp42 n=1 Tax=candidate division MSBL1 archaeon SCGC-AAA261F19 TaxID=1698275 RepID=A0A133VBG0_9EURY|nr:RNA-binding protein [candidate division MSBL1 archaeon SCGC-AAA261F19]